MTISRRNQCLAALIILGSRGAEGAYSFSQSVAMARKPNLVKVSPDASSTAVKLGREGQPATSAQQDLELTRQLIMAHFDAIDAVNDRKANSVINEEIPLVTEKECCIGIQVESTIVNKIEKNPASGEKVIDESIKYGEESVSKFFTSAGKGMFRNLARILGMKFHRPRDGTSVTVS
jgi:hypothetical protein